MTSAVVVSQTTAGTDERMRNRQICSFSSGEDEVGGTLRSTRGKKRASRSTKSVRRTIVVSSSDDEEFGTPQRRGRASIAGHKGRASSSRSLTSTAHCPLDVVVDSGRVSREGGTAGARSRVAPAISDAGTGVVDDDCQVCGVFLVPGFAPPAPLPNKQDVITLYSATSSDEELESAINHDAATVFDAEEDKDIVVRGDEAQGPGRCSNMSSSSPSWTWRGRAMTTAQRQLVEYLTTGRVRGEALAVTAARPPIEIFVASARITLRLKDLRRLRGRRWLTDEVMNAYVACINHRNRQRRLPTQLGAASATTVEHSGLENTAAMAQKGRPPVDSLLEGHGKFESTTAPLVAFVSRPPLRVHVWNTFFFSRLTQGPDGFDFEGVRRWPVKSGVDVAALDMLLFPVNVDSVHWVLAVINFRSRTFLYLDSMHGTDAAGVLPTLRRWLGAEVASCYGVNAEIKWQLGDWATEVNAVAGVPIPRQADSGSCGVFVLQTAEHMERQAVLEFGHEHIPLMRKQIVLDLSDGQV